MRVSWGVHDHRLTSGGLFGQGCCVGRACRQYGSGGSSKEGRTTARGGGCRERRRRSRDTGLPVSRPFLRACSAAPAAARAAGAQEGKGQAEDGQQGADDNQRHGERTGRVVFPGQGHIGGCGSGAVRGEQDPPVAFARRRPVIGQFAFTGLFNDPEVGTGRVRSRVSGLVGAGGQTLAAVARAEPGGGGVCHPGLDVVGPAHRQREGSIRTNGDVHAVPVFGQQFGFQYGDHGFLGALGFHGHRLGLGRRPERALANAYQHQQHAEDDQRNCKFVSHNLPIFSLGK